METLDKCFENVCELDLILHVDKVSCEEYLRLELANDDLSNFNVPIHPYCIIANYIFTHKVRFCLYIIWEYYMLIVVFILFTVYCFHSLLLNTFSSF